MTAESSDVVSNPLDYQVKRKVAYLKIHTKMNVVNLELAAQIVSTLEQADQDPNVECIVIKSHGDKIFSAGFDLKIFQQGLSMERLEKVLSVGGGIARAIMASNKPTIAQIQGSAIGLGCIISLACDFRIVARDKSLFFQLPEFKLGIYPATGATAAALKTLGITHTQEVLFLGEKIYFETFDKWGAVTRACEKADLEKVTRKFAKEIVKTSALMGQLVNQSLKMMPLMDQKQWYDLEDDLCRYYFKGFFKMETPTLDSFLRTEFEKFL